MLLRRKYDSSSLSFRMYCQEVEMALVIGYRIGISPCYELLFKFIALSF